VGFQFGWTEAQRFLTRLIQLPGAGADAVDRAVIDPGCAVCNVFEHEVPVAEFVMAAILNHATGYVRMARAFDSQEWSAIYASRSPHVELSGKVLGLVGYGHIGKAVACRARAFGMRIHAVSQSGRAPDADWVADASRLSELLAVADFVVIACPLMEQTRGLIGRREIETMKRTAVLINIGRAAIVDEESLYLALESGHLGGATLDVWYEYPTPGNPHARPARFPFERLTNVHCTPHSSAWTEEMFQRRYTVIADNLSRLHRGAALRNVI
jgi:phosphoglycerate dehydrogenase-like enzyme